jgi:hypothetical protein
MKGSEEYLHWTERLAKSRDLLRNSVVLIVVDQNHPKFQNCADVFSRPEDSEWKSTS